jgi:hypothetical protein
VCVRFILRADEGNLLPLRINRPGWATAAIWHSGRRAGHGREGQIIRGSCGLHVTHCCRSFAYIYFESLHVGRGHGMWHES